MKRLSVVGVFVDLPGTTPDLVLREVEGPERELHIPIGYPEATWIGYALRGIDIPRPVTQQLLADTLTEFGIRVEQAVISAVREGIWFAHLDLVRGDERRVLTCRPSDAVGLVLRLADHVPLLAVDDVVDRQGLRPAPADPAPADPAASGVADALIGHPDDHGDEHVVGDQGGPAVGDEGQGHPRHGEQAHDTGHDEEGLEAQHGGQAGR
jgi:bifunctional DNase/RNase